MGTPCGPAIPDHILAARKRKVEEDKDSAARSRSGSPDDDSKRPRVTGPQRPPGPQLPAGPQLPSGPSLPTSSPRSRSSSPAGPTLPADTAPRRPPAGPAPPPAPLDEMPSHPANSDSDSDSDSDIGPSLPTASGSGVDEEAAAQARLARYSKPEADASSTGAVKRDEWMLVPPSSFDWASKVDPTKIKSRKFNTSKPGKPTPAAHTPVHNIWTETPEEKRRRLADEVMGVRKAAQDEAPGGEDAARMRARREEEETARRIAEMDRGRRGETLMERHKRGKVVEEDDPSKRAFDREKDIAGGIKIGEAQKREMLKRAGQFGDRFSKGSYL